MASIYHITSPADWEAGHTVGEYTFLGVGFDGGQHRLGGDAPAGG